MKTTELQQLKMAWIVARENGDTETQISLLRDNPEAQAALIDFIAAYHATTVDVVDAKESGLLPLTQRASRVALERRLTGKWWLPICNSCGRSVV